MANPFPEIGFEEAKAARPDVIIGTGRSDYPNQINNVLGFPGIFRGALDVRATAITPAMKAAASSALAALAREPILPAIAAQYGELSFGREYLLPKPGDPRVVVHMAQAVARAAIADGVARVALDLEEYRQSLERRFGLKE